VRIDFKVVDKGCAEFALVVKLLDTIIAKNYGSQAAALEKIGKGEDRLCEMLFVDDQPRGIIVYKKNLQEGNALELKTISVLDPAQDFGKEYELMLLKRLMDIATRRQADRVLATASSASHAKDFFENTGAFTITGTRPGHITGQTEYLFSCHVQRQMVATIAPLRQHQTTPMLSFSGSFGSVQPVAFSPDLTCTLKGQYVRAIRSGKKTFEGRVATPHFRSYVPGKTVEWFAGQTDKVTTEIVSRREFRSFREMLTQIGYDKFVPEVRSLEEAVRLYDGIPGYSEKAQTFGALALEVRVISPQYVPRREAASATNSHQRDERKQVVPPPPSHSYNSSDSSHQRNDRPLRRDRSSERYDDYDRRSNYKRYRS